MSYPTKARIKGKEYPLRTDYRYALRCMQVVNDEGISEEERALAIIYILFGFLPPVADRAAFLRYGIEFLQCGKPQEEHPKQPDFDFQFDNDFIVASFQSDYSIDLDEAEMHWYRYIQLLGGLTEHCILSRVREIRNYDLSDLTGKAKRQMIEAKKAVALPEHLSREQSEAWEQFESLFEEGGEN